MAHQLVYVRTDRNGTKIYHDYNCPRCGGAGRSSKWCFTGGTCWQCSGTGKRGNPAVVKEYTPEYAAKLDARRAKRDAERAANIPTVSEEELLARADEARRNIWELEGFRRDGVGYMLTGNTYANKNAIRAAGGRWNGMLRAYIAPQQVALDGVAVAEVRAQDICNEYGYIDWQKALELHGYID